MARKITYEDKTSKNVSPEENNKKVTANDLNEIKSVVNNNADELENTNNEIFYKSGDTYSTTFTGINGFITNGASVIQLELTLPKRLDNITSVTITEFRAQARGTLGYLNNDINTKDFLSDTDNYTLTYVKRNENTIQIVITKSSAFTNVNNNTPVSLASYVGLTFN